MDRHGEAIEYDLHDRFGLDLLDFFRGVHSWRKLRVLIDRLPASSASTESMLNDPEYARWALEQPKGPPSPPRMADWSTEVDLLARVVDRLAELTTVVASGLGGKPRPPQPVTRPVTEIDRERDRISERRHLALVDEVKAAQERYRQAREGASS